MKKRIIGLLLTLCMVLALTPVGTVMASALDSRVEKAIAWAVSIANDNSHGYSQSNRNGPNYDCSSFVSTAFNQAGFNISPNCWTGNMEAAFKAAGFQSYPASSVTLQRGDILLNPGSHVELYLGNSQCVAAHCDEDGKTGDSTGHEIEVRSVNYCTYCKYKQYTIVLRYGGSSDSLDPADDPFFDVDVYYALYPDLASAYGKDKTKLYEHWVTTGQAEGRVSSLIFDAQWYLAEYDDVANTYGRKNYAGAYEHFLQFGIHEGRAGSPFFCGSFYLDHYPDLKKLYGNDYVLAANHFAQYGIYEQRMASPYFSVAVYADKNPDVAETFSNIKDRFIHYIQYVQYGNEERSALYVVTYNANGGSGAPSQQVKYYANGIDEPLTLSTTKPTRTGYVFNGWATSRNASQPDYQPGGTYTKNGDQTLYAVWTAVSSTIAPGEHGASPLVEDPPVHQHDLTCHSLVESTCTTDGNLKYWYCTDCGKYFSDADATHETTASLITLKALGHNYVDGECTRCSAADPDDAEPDLGYETPTLDISGLAPVQEVHFEKQALYFQGQFSDVSAGQWFTQNVAEAYELGLMKGIGEDAFDPYGEVTLAQAITMAARVHSIYDKGYEDFDQSGGKWYQVYLDYAYQNGIISWAYYNADVERKATRAQFAEIFASALPEDALGAINTVPDNAIPDVSISDACAPYVYTLYRAGVLTGGDANGTFSPQTYITRAEAAAIVSRMAESNNRVSFSLH